MAKRESSGWVIWIVMKWCKRIIGEIIILTALFSIFTIKVIDLPTEEIKVEYEALNDEKPDTQEIMDKLVKESEAVNMNDAEITYDEAQMLMKMAMAEAEGDGVEGKAMVMAVIMNRVKDKRFPNTIKEVIYQNRQFSPIKDGRYDKAVPDNECHLALAEIEQGKYDDIEALYFENASNSWQASNCEYLYTIGHHRFYK